MEETIIILSYRVHLTGVQANAILEMFGKMFFKFCQESGYDTILQVLGATVSDFLQVSNKPEYLVVHEFIFPLRIMSAFVTEMCSDLLIFVIEVY